MLLVGNQRSPARRAPMISSQTAPFGAMSRDQIFCLAAWLIHTRGKYKGEADAAVRVVLEKLASCFPEDPADPRFGALHRRLARGCSPEGIRQFLLWLCRSAQAGKGLRGPENASWAYARCWLEIEAIMTEVPNRPWTATPPNPWLHTVTPELAWEAVGRLSAPLDQRGSAEQVKEDELAFKAVIGQWTRLETWRNWIIYCPACSTEISLLRDPLHISRCHCHPAHRRFVAAQKALASVAMAPAGGSAELVVEVKPRFPTYVSDYEAEKTLTKLVQRKHGDGLPDLTDLEAVLTEWERSRPAYKFVCPGCKESSEIRDAPKHLMACGQHPAALKAVELERELRARSGANAEVLLEVTTACDSLRSMLSLLSQATEVFAGNLHWSRDGLYSKPIDERPWRVIQERAQEVLRSCGPSAGELCRHEMGSSPLHVAKLQDERSAYAHALAHLVEANRAYWSAMRDWEGGRSLQDERQVTNWESARVAAQGLIQSARSTNE